MKAYRGTRNMKQITFEFVEYEPSNYRLDGKAVLSNYILMLVCFVLIVAVN